MEIEVREPAAGEPEVFDVVLREGASQRRYRVRVPPSQAARLAPGAPAARVVEAAFRFLLDREPPQAILPTFEIGLIARYFPEFDREIGGYVAALDQSS